MTKIFMTYAALLLASQVVWSQPRERPDDDHHQVSPVRRIARDHAPDRPQDVVFQALVFRTIDGTQNNAHQPNTGATHTPLLRLVEANYADGVSALSGNDRPGPREISNAVCDQDQAHLNDRRASSFLWQWGQFLDHDIDLTDGSDPPELADIDIPTGDLWFDPQGSGEMFMAFNRSLYDVKSGSDDRNPRQQLNEITAWIDGSQVYGSDLERADALRRLDGSGKLKTNDGYLPNNVDGFANAGGSSDQLFLAGDVRANEQVGLLALHTLFVREHNRLAQELVEREPGLSGDEIYQQARMLVGAQIQHITYSEFLPLLLGPMAPGPYRGYRDDLDASIANSFSTAAYRVGHTMLNDKLLRLGRDGREIAEGHLALRDAFFAPDKLVEGGLAPVLRGLAAQQCEGIDIYIIEDVRNFLFGPPGSGGFDLASLNIQRGRDHGLPSYNDTRRQLGLRPARRWSDITRDDKVQAKLASVYGRVDDVDLWVGGLAEDAVDGAMIGACFATIIRDQFEALRDGDRYWYEERLDPRQRRDIENTRLSDVIRRNTNIGDELADDVFIVP